MITGTLTEQPRKRFIASISTLMFDTELQIVPNVYKTEDHHPDYHAEVRSPRGRMIRVGAMWTATSERTGATYYSLTITDSRGDAWRMNAVRNEDSEKGVWRIVPLAGGQTEKIAVDGELELLDDGGLSGVVAGYDFDYPFVAIPSETKTEEAHPDYHIEARSPAGRMVRMGAIWKATSDRSGKDYFSIAFSTPYGTQHRANAVLGNENEPGKFKIIPLADLKAVAA